MISIFNGVVRGIGVSDKKEVFLQLQVRFRRYLKHFTPAQIMVFIYLALHMDEKGWAWPKIQTICEDTGLERKTVHRAINGDKKVNTKGLGGLEIKGQRVLLHFQGRDESRGQFRSSYYLLFPTKEELDLNDRGLLEPPPNAQKRNTVKRNAARRHSELRTAAGRNAADVRGHHVHEQEPSFKQEPPLKEHETHTQPEAARRAAPDVREGGSRFSLEQCRQYALHLRRTDQGITNPGGYATAIYRSGEADALIETYLSTPDVSNVSKCPDCDGGGFVKTVYVEQGQLKRCSHPKMPGVSI